MRAPFTQLYVHLIWATWDRLPLLEGEIERAAHQAVLDKCRALRCEPLAIGGTADHLHLLARLATTVSVAELVKGLKGSSSHLITHQIRPGEFFKWQGAYGAFTLTKDLLPRVRLYIERQKQHHAQGEIIPIWEQVFEEVNTQPPD